ncbi:MAG: phosphatase PAP2 family protein [Bacteroidales bacterium]|nr:MAG: phosphatase PAP2 family protein [Bacteroidales bacterium]
MKKILFILPLLITISQLYAQKQDRINNSIYKINLWLDIPVTIAGFITNDIGLRVVKNKPPLDSLKVVQLDPSEINWFDRGAARQNVDSYSTAIDISDYGASISMFLPLLLFADEEIRKDWYKILILFLEAEAINGNAYSWLAAVHIDRMRPLVYNSDFPLNKRLESRNRNSFFSGHVSTVATASFFTAKVYSDYHPELGRKKYIIYSAALIPPIFVGACRYKSGKHFPTDIITGLAVGASIGILTPHLHKNKNYNPAVIPVTGSFTGLSLSYKF